MATTMSAVYGLGFWNEWGKEEHRVADKVGRVGQKNGTVTI
jgi:hypothetical protein